MLLAAVENSMTLEPLPESSDVPKRSRAANAVQSGPAAPFAPTSVTFAVDMSFVSDDEIAELNRDYRHKNKPTDVLSFSQWEGDAPFFVLPTGEPLPLGDLVISIETAQRQAVELHHTLSQEIEFLAVHGALHLLGYDHIRDADRRVMWQWQEAITEGMKAEG